MEQQKKMEITIEDKVAEGIYVNSANIMHNKAEVVIDFTRIVPPPGKVKVLSRVIMNPMHAKLLLKALENNIEKYEKQFGAIQIDSVTEKKVGFNQ
jgi:hypothetical protein